MGSRRPLPETSQVVPARSPAEKAPAHHSVHCAQPQSTAGKLTARSKVSSPPALLIVTVPASSADSREFTATEAVSPDPIGSTVPVPQPVWTVTAELAASASLVTET